MFRCCYAFLFQFTGISGKNQNDKKVIIQGLFTGKTPDLIIPPDNPHKIQTHIPDLVTTEP